MAQENRVLLPHGPGFRLVHEITDLDPFPESATANYHYKGNESWLAADHFPGNPIMPGVMIIEAMAQTAIQTIQLHPEMADKIFLFQAIKDARFIRIVKPNTILTLNAIISWTEEGRRGLANCVAKADDKTVAEALIEFAVIKKRR